MPCPGEVQLGGDDYNHLRATWRVRDTLEQIDVSKLLMQKYSETFQFAASSKAVKAAFANKKIAGLIGIEG